LTWNWIGSITFSVKYKKILLLLPLFFFVLVPSVLAVSSSYLVNAQKWYNEECKRRPDRVRNEAAVLCYAFDKFSELQSSVNSHEQRITALENVPTPTQGVSPTSQPTANPPQEINEIVIFPHGNLQNEAFSDVHDLSDHKMLVLSCLWTNGAGGIWVYHSDDQIEWELDYRAGCSGNTNNDYKQVISTVKNKYYKFKVINSFGGEIKAILY
jgi:hypothetical protein